MERNKEIGILIVGAGDYKVYERAFYEAFKELGYENVRLFTWNQYLRTEKKNSFCKMIKKAENKFQIGPDIVRINKALVAMCKEQKPDLVFVYSGILIWQKTIYEIKVKYDAKIIYYNNDDPFAAFYPKYHWRHYKKSLKYADFSFVYREKNCWDIQKLYNVPTAILKSYYIENANYPISEEEQLDNIPDVVFLGHFEDDERNEYMKALTDNGISVGVPEQHITKFHAYNDKLESINNSHTEYNRVLCSCKIPLIFLSKINHDTYTRRCFEIPAAGAMIFCPYTDDMAAMFEEGKEAVYFRNKEEFVSKIQYFLANDFERMKIAEAGRKRLLKEGHEAKNRVKQILDVFEKL